MRRTSGFAPFDIAVCGIDELSGYCAVGVSHVLSILDPGFPRPPAFGTFGEHERLELRFHDIIDDREGMIAPGITDVAALLSFGRDLLAEPPADAHLLVHCHAGISRSTAAMTLLLTQARPDLPPADALREVVRIRPGAWPNLRIIELGDQLLDCRGQLVSAVMKHYHKAVAQDPSLAFVMVEAGREREVRHILEA